MEVSEKINRSEKRRLRCAIKEKPHFVERMEKQLHADFSN